MFEEAFSRYIKQLCKEYEVQANFGEGDTCTLSFPTSHVVEMEEVAKHFVWKAKVGDKGGLKLLDEALETNLALALTGNCALYWDKSSETLHLQERLDASISYAAWFERLEKFTDSVDFWKKQSSRE